MAGGRCGAGREGTLGVLGAVGVTTGATALCAVAMGCVAGGRVIGAVGAFDAALTGAIVGVVIAGAAIGCANGAAAT